MHTMNGRHTTLSFLRSSFAVPPLAALGAIMVLGLALRIYGLTSYGVWFDEAYHVQLVKLPSVGTMLDAVLSNPPSDPLYVLVLRAWTDWFGTDDASIRSLSVISGTLTLPATYALGVAFAGRAAGLLGALFLALSPYAIEFGQEAALYALVSLLTTLALAAAFRWQSTGKGQWLYVGLGVLAIYSHYVVAAILLLLAAFQLRAASVTSRVEKAQWLGTNALIVFTWLPWLTALTLHWFGSPLPRATLRHPATGDELVGALVQFSSGTASLQQHREALWVMGLLSGGLLLGGGWLAGRMPERRAVSIILLVSSLIFFVPAIASKVTGLWLFVPHFMLFLLPALLVCLASGCYLLPKDRFASNRSYVLSVLMAAAFFAWVGAQVWGVVLFYRYPPHGADGLRELAFNIEQGRVEEDVVFVTPPALTPTLMQYYQGQVRGLPEEFDLRRVYIPYDANDWRDRSLRIVGEEMTGDQRFWLVYRPELDYQGSLLAALKERFRLFEQNHYEYAELFLFAQK
jgi:uncharacterized membrane protein